MPERIVITGPTGAVGMALIQTYIAHGCEVVALCHKGSSRNRRLPDSPLLHAVEMDLDDITEITASDLPECDIFYHLAWRGTTGAARNDMKLQTENIASTIAAVEFHKKHGRLATMTAIQPGGRFGTLEISDNNTIERFAEKKKEDGGWINGGYMVLEPEVLEYIEGDSTTFEREPLERLSEEGQLIAYKYNGFWQCMDTMKDKMYLEELLSTGKAPWKVWED